MSSDLDSPVVGDIVANALLDTTPRQVYERAVHAERRAQRLEDAMRHVLIRPPSEAREIATWALKEHGTKHGNDT